MSLSSQYQKSNQKNLIIFDFDGVIADSFDTFYPLIRAGMKKIGISISENDYRNLFNDNVHHGFKKLIGDEDRHQIFTKFRARNYNKYYKNNPPKLFLGAKKLLKSLEKNYILSIASSGKKHNITWLLKKTGSVKHFDIILATNDLSKEDMLIEIMKKHGADPQQTFMITDTVGDIKIAKKLGLKTVAVGWGFQSSADLKMAKPYKLAKRMTDLEKILSK